MIGNYIGIPNARKKGNVLPSWVKDSIEFWYDVKKQRATNESLSNCPYLIDFATARHSFLPKGYIELQYLEGDGYAYIDSGYAFIKPDLRYKFKYEKQ